MAITGTFKEQSIINRGDVRTVTDVYTYNEDFEWESEMPTQGDIEGGLYFVGYTQANPNPYYVDVSLVWSESQTWTVIFQPEEADTVSYADASTVEEPIETNPFMLMKWAYDLYQRDSMVDALENWATTDTYADGAKPTDKNADGIQWLWSKTFPGKGWRRDQDRTKPVESWLRPQFAVREQVYHRDITTAQGVLQQVGTITPPTELFGYDFGDFFLIGSNLSFDGKFWIATNNFRHSGGEAGWDTDVYGDLIP